MPSKNVVKTFTENSYYHIYNRGVEKRRIFQDREDYNKFTYYLNTYLSSVDDLYKEMSYLRLNLEKNNLSSEVDLLAYCLMPNHFHILVKQNTKDGITKLMRQLTTAYSMYFNKRNGRVGPLFQGTYKASLISSDEYLIHVSRYIHLNPIGRGASLSEFEWSSYLDYIGSKSTNWVKTQTILSHFKKENPNKDYQLFTEEQKQTLILPKNLLLEEE